MNLDDHRAGDLIEFRRCAPRVTDSLINVGIFLGLTWDITPTGVGKYVRLHMLELGGKMFSVICWIEKDTITKLG